MSTIAVRAIVGIGFSFGNSCGFSLSLAIVASVGPVAPKVSTVASVRATVANSSVVATEANSVAVAVVRVGLSFRSGSGSGCQSKNKQLKWTTVTCEPIKDVCVNLCWSQID